MTSFPHPPRVLQALHDIAIAVSGVLDSAALARLVGERAAELLHADAVVLQQWDEAAGGLRPLYVSDPQVPSTYPPVPRGRGTTGHALVQRAPVVVEDYPAWEHALPWLVDLGVRSSMAVPLVVADRAIGALAVRFYRPHRFSDEDVQTVVLLAAQVAPALEAARLYAASEQRRSEAEAVAKRLAFLAEASKQLAASLDYTDTLQRIADLVVPTLADLATVHVLQEDGSLRRLAAAHASPERRRLLRELQRRYPRDGRMERGLLQVLSSREATLHAEVTSDMLAQVAQDEEHLRLLLELRLHSAMLVPLQSRGMPQGVLSLLTAESGRRYTPTDLDLAQDLASRASLAVENAQLYEAAQREIAERKVAESALQAAERSALQTEKLRALGQMASGIAHNLNQSLALVAGYGDLARNALAETPPAVQRASEMLAIVSRAALDGGATVQRLLTFARSRADQPPQWVDLGALLAEVAQLTAPRWRDGASAEGRAIQLTVATPPEPLGVLGIAPSLREALTNLVFNAVDALPGGGSIQLGARRVDGQVEVTVADDGVGMAPEVQARIFEPFFTTKGDRGTGLGLAQVFGIVERHQGTIDLESAPGAGATFRLRFPVAEPLEGGERRPRAAEARPLRVLAVDDEPSLARLVALLLEQQGHTVDTAASGEQALAALERGQRYDVVVADLGLGGGLSGWDVAERIRDCWPDTRVVLATGWGAQIDLAEARARGVSTVLAKPYRLDALVRAVSGEASAR